MSCKHTSWVHLGHDEWSCADCGTLDSFGDPEDMTDEERSELGVD